MKEKFNVIILSLLLVFVLSLTPLHAYGNNCPKSTVVRVWEPAEWWTEGAVFGDLRHYLTTTDGYGQGYWVYHNYDSDKTDYSFGTCTRENWNLMDRYSAIFVLTGHRDNDSPDFVAAYNRSEINFLDPASPYEFTWTDFNADGVKDYDGMRIEEEADHSAYYVCISPELMGEMFQSNLEENNAIVFLAFCQSDVDSDACLNYCYGNIGFGYDYDATVGDEYMDTEILFGFMSGVFGNGEYREAIDAYNRGVNVGVSGEKIKSIYKTNTGDYPYNGLTLCPSVVETKIYPDEGGCISEGEGGGYSGVGHFLFDSHCDTNRDPWDLIEWISTPPGSGFTITDVHWSEVDGYEDTALVFHYCSPNNYNAYITAYAYALFGMQALDGGTSAINGVAPNTNDPYILPISETE